MCVLGLDDEVVVDEPFIVNEKIYQTEVIV